MAVFLLEKQRVIKLIYQNKVVQALLSAFFMSVLSTTAHAQVSGAPSGGLFAGNISNVADDVLTTIIWVTFIMAILYILWQVAECLFDRKTWSDIIAKCLIAVAIGATPAGVAALWRLGQSVTLG